MFAYDGAFWRRLASMGARKLPSSVSRYVSPLVGTLVSLGLPRSRAAVSANLERIRGPVGKWQDKVDVARTFAAFGSCLGETLARGSKNEGRLQGTYEGAPHMHDAIAHNKGVLLLSMHTGGWEISTPLFAEVTHLDVLVVMESERSLQAQAIQDTSRTSSGTRYLRVGGDPLSALPIIRHLENKGAVAMQVDRPPPSGRTVLVNLLGRPYEIPEGALRIAQVSGAPLLPVFSARIGFHAYYLKCYPALYLPRRPTPNEFQHVAQQIADAMGDFLTRFPTQWFQFS